MGFPISAQSIVPDPQPTKFVKVQVVLIYSEQPLVRMTNYSVLRFELRASGQVQMLRPLRCTIPAQVHCEIIGQGVFKVVWKN